MSRPLKYRGYVRSIHGTGIFNVKSINFFPLVIELDMEDEVVSFFEFDNVQLLQYSGLKDKNGQEIYEGDLIRFNEVKKNNIFEVIYGRCSFEFIRESGSIYRADQLLWSDVEVISNIFETGKSRKLDILYDEHPNGGPKFPF